MADFKSFISDFGGRRALDFSFLSALGLFDGVNIVRVLGFSNVIAQTEIVLSPTALTLDDVFPEAGTSLVVTSDSSNDTSSGTGAQSIILSLLNDDFEEVSPLISMNGPTGASVSGTFSRLQLGFVAAVGSGGINEGTIFIGDSPVVAGLPTVIRMVIMPGIGRSEQAHITIPNNRTILFDGVLFSASSLGNTDIQFMLRVRGAAGTPFFGAGRVDIGVANLQATSKRAFTFTEKTDIAVTVKGATGANNSASTLMEGFSVRNSRLEK